MNLRVFFAFVFGLLLGGAITALVAFPRKYGIAVNTSVSSTIAGVPTDARVARLSVADAFSRLVDDMSAGDLKSAAEACLKITNPVERDGVLAGVFERWLKENPDHAVQFARSANPSVRAHVTELMFRCWGRVDAAKALRSLQENPDFRKNDKLFALTYSGWSEVDPVAAQAQVAALPFTLKREAALDGVGRVLIEDDPSKALNWAVSLAPSRGRSAIIDRAGKLIAATDPQRVIELASKQGADGLRLSLLQTALYFVAKSDPNTAFTQLDSYGGKDATARSFLSRSIFKAIAESSPTEALKKFEQVIDPREQKEAFTAISSEWASQDVKAAAQWTGTLPDSPLKSVALTTVVNEWLDQDQPSALDWITNLPSTNNRSYAIAVACGKLAFEFPDMMVDLANSIPDREMRRRALNTIDSKWNTLSQDQAAKLRHRMVY